MRDDKFVTAGEILTGKKNGTHFSTPCAGTMLEFFGVEGVTWNNRTRKNVWDNTLRRNGFSVRSRMSQLKTTERTVGASRRKLKSVAKSEGDIIAFVVRVQGHVLVLNRDGQTVVDTDKRIRDKRKVLGVFAVMRKV